MLTDEAIMFRTKDNKIFAVKKITFEPRGDGIMHAIATVSGDQELAESFLKKISYLIKAYCDEEYAAYGEMTVPE